MSAEPFAIDRFYKFLDQHKLMASKCLKCKKINLPPRPLCDNCLSQEFEWVEISGKGKLVTYTVIHVSSEKFQALTPYVAGIVELDNGLRLPGMINGLKPEELKVGAELTLDFGSCSTAQAWPKWSRYCFKPV